MKSILVLQQQGGQNCSSTFPTFCQPPRTPCKASENINIFRKLDFNRHYKVYKYEALQGNGVYDGILQNQFYFFESKKM